MIRSQRETTVNPFDGIDLERRPRPPRDEKLTEKQRLFAEAYAAGVPPAQAWREAGYVSVYASDRAMTDGVKLHIAQFQHEHAERNRVTVDSLLKELEAARHAAMGLCQIAAAITATMGKAKLLGMLVDRSKSEHTVDVTVARAVRDPTELKTITADEWVRLYKPPMKLVN